VGKASYPDLSAEMLALTFDLISNRNIINLRLASKFFYTTAKLRLLRVFPSTNPPNNKVFRAIADNNILRHNITEII
jgi:hypothetical protein